MTLGLGGFGQEGQGGFLITPLRNDGAEGEAVMVLIVGWIVTTTPSFPYAFSGNPL